MASDRVSLKGKLRAMRLAIAWFCLLCLPAICAAKNNCPWINEATAGGLLNGDAVGEFTEAAAGAQAVCIFTQKGVDITRTLRVTVEISSNVASRMATLAAPCGTSAAPVRAIGNEAVVCDADDRKAQVGELMVGRVRDQVFTIKIGSSLKNDPILTRGTLRLRIYMAAEQIAGNLY